MPFGFVVLVDAIVQLDDSLRSFVAQWSSLDAVSLPGAVVEGGSPAQEVSQEHLDTRLSTGVLDLPSGHGIAQPTF